MAQVGVADMAPYRARRAGQFTRVLKKKRTSKIQRHSIHLPACRVTLLVHLIPEATTIAGFEHGLLLFSSRLCLGGYVKERCIITQGYKLVD